MGPCGAQAPCHITNSSARDMVGKYAHCAAMPGSKTIAASNLKADMKEAPQIKANAKRPDKATRSGKMPESTCSYPRVDGPGEIVGTTCTIRGLMWAR